MIPTWLILALSSVVFYAGIELFYKIFMMRNRNVSANISSIYTAIFLFLWSLPLFFYSKQVITLENTPWIILITEGFAYTIAVYFFYESFKVISASIATTVGMSSVIVSTIAGILFFGETISIQKLVGFALILCSVGIINWEKSPIKAKGILWAFVGGLFFGVGYSLDKHLASNLNYPIESMQILYPLIIIPMKAMLEPRNFFKNMAAVKLSSLWSSAAAGLCILLAYFLSYKAYTIGGEVSKIDVINNTMVFVIILGEAIFFKDRSDIGKKLICASITFIGVLLLR